MLSTSGPNTVPPGNNVVSATNTVHSGDDEADSNVPACTPHVKWWASVRPTLMWMAPS